MENILLDGSFIVEKKMDDFFEFAKLANLFVCNATLGEVQKSDFYAKLTSAKVEDVELLPNGKSLKNGDKCKKYTLENSLVIYEIVRDEYIHVLTVEGKVLQIAKDYHLAIDTSYDQKRLKAKVIH